MTAPPVPSKLNETKQTQPEMKVKNRKSWMFWKPSTPVQQQQ